MSTPRNFCVILFPFILSRKYRVTSLLYTHYKSVGLREPLLLDRGIQDIVSLVNYFRNKFTSSFILIQMQWLVTSMYYIFYLGRVLCCPKKLFILYIFHFLSQQLSLIYFLIFHTQWLFGFIVRKVLPFLSTLDLISQRRLSDIHEPLSSSD